MDNTFQKGDYIEVELSNGTVYNGWFQSQKKDKSSITLLDVKEMPKGSVVEARLTFYRPEVSCIRRIQETQSEVATNDQSFIVSITNKEVESLEVLSKKFIFINQIDDIYRNAIIDLNHHGYVAVGTEGSEMGRKCKLPLLTVSTPSQIYIFDIQVLQNNCFDSGLKKILESDKIKKIIHNSSKLSDCLFHRHHIELKNVFDTQVADVIIYKNKFHTIPPKLRSLDKCLNYYIGLSGKIIDKVDIVEWSKRPLTVEIKEMASKNIVYLHRLSEIMDDEMSAPFTKGVAYYVDRLRQSNDYEAWTSSSQDKQLTEEFQEAIGWKIKK